jgi:hypothetical protein
MLFGGLGMKHSHILAATSAAAFLCMIPALAQTAAPRIPRMADGKPNLTGLWQAMGTADWDIEDHSAAAGPFFQLGAIGAIPPGQGVVEGGAIPYKPAALEQKNKNFANRMKDDPEVKCYMPGVPRAAYLPYPFQIIQSNKDVLFAYEYATTNRLINMGKPQEAATDTWMGTSNGHWEKDTLVVDVTGFNGLAWLDQAGHAISDKLHLTERYTRTDSLTLKYEVTIDDPGAYSQPWTTSNTIHWRPGMELMESICQEDEKSSIHMIGNTKK